MHASAGVVTFLFTDIEGSTRLWEEQPERMQVAVASHDAIARAAVEHHRGRIVKMAGDGVHAVFDDPLDGVEAALQLQQELADPAATGGIALHVRCGLHAGVDERRDNDFFGRAVNRAARISGVAHGGQVLLSQAVASLVRDRLRQGSSLRDLGTVRLRGLTTPEQVFQLVHPELRVEFPSLRSLEATPNNLPLQVTSFVGRERELADVKRLLAGTRLLTLLGVGGIGKTRLSLQVALEVMDDYPDGAWFVELAPLSDPELVQQAVASVLGVKEEAGRPLLEALEKHVASRNELLILDNCEHVVHACAELAERLLQAGRQLKILTSSREHLHVAGETTYLVPTLGIPDPSDAPTPETLSEYESIRLFVDRAVAAQPAFTVTERNARPITEICRRLDGIPLAIELAAARVRALSIDTIAERLNDRFRLLTGGSRTALPRQQTLRALIDWSYDLLTDQERALFRRLAVFAGGWTLDAAEAVGTDGEIERTGVLEALIKLVEKSLVVSEFEGRRYRLLETIRQYAQERLKDSGEDMQARARHFAFYSALAERARPELVGPQQAAWLSLLDTERENLLVAHRWCDSAETGGELGLKLVSSVWRYWMFRGLLALGYRITVEAISRVGAQRSTHTRCRALFDAGQLACVMARYGEARKHLDESLEIARAIEDKRRVAEVLQPLGLASLGQGDVVAARAYLEEALTLAQQLDNKREIAAALNALAQVHRLQANLIAAESLYKQVLTLARELGDRESIAIGLLNLAMVSVGRGAAPRASTMLLEALSIAREIGSRPAGQSVLEVSAGVAAALCDWAHATRFYGAAEEHAAQTGLRRDPADEAFLEPLIARARATMGGAAFVAGDKAGRSLSYEEAMDETRAWLASVFPRSP